MNRKTFFQKTLGALLIAIPAVTLIGCNSDAGLADLDPTGDPDPDASCGEAGTVSDIGSNHGHNLVVSKGDIRVGREKTYNIQGTAGHNHSVTLGPSDYDALQNNTAIEVNSTSGDGHIHSIIVSCG